MATYFGASEMQSDGLKTLYLMNPGYPGYSGEMQTPATNMIYLNSAGNQLNQANLSISHPTQQNQQLVGIPIQAPAAASQDLNGPSLNYNLWTSINPSAVATAARNTHQSATTAACGGGVIADMASQLGLRRSGGPQPMAPSQQGLSLSLSPQQPGYGAYRSETSIRAQEISPGGGDDMRISGSSSSAVSAVSNGISSLQSVLMGSRYLKATQQLLDEVVSVGNGIKSEGTKGQTKANRDSPLMEASGGVEINGKRVAELTTGERQEIQIRKAKLINMLDEV